MFCTTETCSKANDILDESLGQNAAQHATDVPLNDPFFAKQQSDDRVSWAETHCIRGIRSKKRRYNAIKNSDRMHSLYNAVLQPRDIRTIQSKNSESIPNHSRCALWGDVVARKEWKDAFLGVQHMSAIAFAMLTLRGAIERLVDDHFRQCRMHAGHLAGRAIRIYQYHGLSVEKAIVQVDTGSGQARHVYVAWANPQNDTSDLGSWLNLDNHDWDIAESIDTGNLG